MFIVYDAIFFFCALLYLPCLAVRGKWHRGFWMRLGLSLSALREACAGRNVIWFHAVSVGEVLAVENLILRMKEKFSGHTFILSTVTPTGQRLAQTQLKDICRVIYAPLDFGWVVRRYIRAIRPKMYICAETEIWPNLYRRLQKEGVSIIQVNGRISDRAFEGYKRISVFVKRVLDCISVFCMQSPLDAERVMRLGAEPSKVHVVGNLKFDSLPETAPVAKKDFGFEESDRLLVAGSTHPGEEEIVMETYTRLRGEFPRLRLVIVPRHIERAGDIARLVQQKGFLPLRLSQCRDTKGDAQAVLIVDSIGYLRAFYSLAEVVFIGKTFKVGGGQNMIEPLYFGKPTFVGPWTQNFKDVVRIFLRTGALVQVRQEEALWQAMREFLASPSRAEAAGASAREMIKSCQGATQKTLELVSQVLKA